MARGDFKQRVVFEVEDQASGNVEKIEGRFGKLGSFLKDRFTITLGDVVSLFKSVAGAAGDVVKAAEEQENAVAGLDQALAALGPRAGEVSKALQDQAASLEATTKFSDEAIIKNQALALNLGVSADQAGKLTAAAVELSSATGGSLESSFVNLARTLNGFRGELGELVPEVAGMTAEQLKAGAALEVVLDRLGGSSAAQVGTFSGAVAQLGNAWGTVKEKLGEAITSNDGLREGIGKLRDLITSQKFLSAIESIASGFATITTKALELILHLDKVKNVLNNWRIALEFATGKVFSFIGALRQAADFLTFGLSTAIQGAVVDLALYATHADLFTSASEKAANETARLGSETSAAASAAANYRDNLRSLTPEVIATTVAEVEEGAALDGVTDAAYAATESFGTFEQAHRSLKGEADSLTNSLNRTAKAAAQVNAATGGRVTARDKRNQADVDAALAAGRRPIMGGTRILTADGSGSRLIRN